MKSNVWKKAAAALMAAAMFAGCSSSGSGNSGDAASGEALGDTVKIGLNFEMTGNVSDYGIKEYRGAQVAIDQWNAREDKPFTVEGVEMDDAGVAEQSVQAIKKLVESDKVVGVVGPATSGASIATYQYASDSKVPVISPSATQVDATIAPGGTVYEYAWRVCFEDSYQGKAMAIYAVQNLDAKNAVIFNEKSDYGQGLAKAFKEELEAEGGSVVDEISYDSGEKDFASQVTKIKDKDFDVIYVAGYYNEAAQIIKAARKDGIECPIIGADGFDSEDLINQLGADSANNIFYTTGYTAADPSDELQKFIDDYEAKWGDKPSMFAALAYDATNLLLDSLEATGKTGPELNAAIEKADFSGVTGSFTFNTETHTPNKTVLVVELVNGEQSNVQEVEVE